jgi:transketolase
MEAHVVFVFTHDSIGLGEDGPTHQPIEHLAALRAIPHLLVIRPADANEVAAAWKVAVERKGPVALALTRQNLPILDEPTYGSPDRLARGGYVLQSDEDPEVLLIGTGSEVHIALEAAEALRKEQVRVRVVSLPSWELFAQQDQSYRDEVLPPRVKARVAVEAASSFGWERWIGDGGAFVGMHGFGASAPYKDLYRNFGITAEEVGKAALRLLGRGGEKVDGAPVPGHQPPGAGHS